MSNRNISENLEYFIDNQGVHLDAPVLDINGSTSVTIDAPSVLINGVTATTGTVTGSATVSVGSVPNRIIQTYWPRMLQYGKQFILVAATPQDLDWSGGVNVETFSFFPSVAPSGLAPYVELRPGSPTHWQFYARGHLGIMVNGTPTVALSDNAVIKIQILISFDSGATFFPHATIYNNKGGAGTPAVDAIGGQMTHIFLDPNQAVGVNRIKLTAECSENKTVDLTVQFIVLYPIVV